VLRRLLRYAEKVLDLSSEVLDRVTDARPQPRTPTTLVLKSALAMFWARLGSLNALETVSTARFWERWLGGAMTSADTMGRVHAAVNAGQLRNGIHYVYSRLKRNKALIRMSPACSPTSSRSAASVAVETANGGTFRIWLPGRR